MEHGGNLAEIERNYGICRSRIIDFSANINPFIRQSILSRAIRAGLPNIRHYPDPEYVELKAAFARYAGTGSREIVPGNGSAELIFRFIQALQPAHALVVTPGFSEYEEALAAAGTRVTRFRLEADNGFAPEADRLTDQLVPGCKLLVLGNPNNPTGTCIGRQNLEIIIDRACSMGTKVLLDEAFIEFTGLQAETTAVPLTARYGNLVIARSLTKFFAIPGLRLGYTICSDAATNRMLAANLNPWNINCLAEQAALYLLNRPALYRKALQKITAERDYLYKSLCAFPWLKPFRTQANFILVQILNHISARGLQELLLKKGILVRDASNFTHLDDTFIRVAVKERRANRRLLRALKKTGF